MINKGGKLYTPDGELLTWDEFGKMSFAEQMKLMGFAYGRDPKDTMSKHNDFNDENEEYMLPNESKTNAEDEYDQYVEYELLQEALRSKGFEAIDTGEWFKYFHNSGRTVVVSYDGDGLIVNFNESENVYISPKTLIRVFLGV